MIELELLSRQLKSVSGDNKPTVSSHCRLERGDIIGNYEVGNPLGKGRFATVWSARNKTSGALVAIKVYRMGTSNGSYFENEVKILNRIFEMSMMTQTPPTNLIGYLGTFAHVTIGHDRAPRIHPCILFNLAGDSVSRLLKFCRRTYGKGLPVNVVKKIMRDTLTGLAYLHKCNIIHTDIKPSNLLMNKKIDELDESGVEISLGDLGSSTVADELFSEHVGTTQYCAPELILELPYSFAIDIWAAFAMCFELITGDLLFDVYAECGITYGEDVDGELIDGGYNSDSGNECYVENDVTSTTMVSSHYAPRDGGDSSGSEDSENMEQVNYRHLLLIEKVIGPAPREFTRQARLYYNRRDKLKNNPDIVHVRIPELLFANYEMDMKDCKRIGDFLLCGLKYMPEDRITAEQALQHPFFINDY